MTFLSGVPSHFVFFAMPTIGSPPHQPVHVIVSVAPGRHPLWVVLRRRHHPVAAGVGAWRCCPADEEEWCSWAGWDFSYPVKEQGQGHTHARSHKVKASGTPRQVGGT